MATAGEKPGSMQLVRRDALGECPDQIEDIMDMRVRAP